MVAHRGRDDVEVGHRPGGGRAGRAPRRSRPPAGLDEVGVVEVRMHARRGDRAARRARRGLPAAWSSAPPSDRPPSVDARRRASSAHAAPSGRYPRPGRARRAVGVAELGAGEHDRAVRVPAAAAEERRPEALLTQPETLLAHTLPGRAAGGTRVRRAREVRVVAERPAVARPRARGASHRSASSSPAAASGGRMSAAIARPPGRCSWRRGERRPDLVVERSFDVARDHCVPFRSRGRHRATHTTRRSRPSWWPRRRRAAPLARPRDRAGRRPRGVRREERHVRADARLERDVRLPARRPLGVHPAAVRVVPGDLYWPLERSWLVVGLAQVAVAVATALLVLAIGRRLASLRTGVIAALVATCIPTSSGTTSTSTARSSTGCSPARSSSRPRRVRAPLASRSRRLGAVIGLAILSNARLAAPAARARPPPRGATDLAAGDRRRRCSSSGRQR